MLDTETKKQAAVPQPFKTQTGLELANTAPEEYHGLVDGLLPEVGVSMWCGKPKVGKSSLGRQAAVCVAEGTPFLGKPTLCGDVLYLNLEGPLGVVKEHFKKLGVTEKRGKIHVVHEPMPYRGELGLQRLEQTLKGLPNLKLVIVDPVGKLLRMADSDSYDEVQLAIEKLEQLAKQYQLHLMFLTHGKKRDTDDDGDSPIGSTAFRGGTDTNIYIKKRGTQRIISTEQRWGVAMEPTILLFDEVAKTYELGPTLADEESAKHKNKERKTVERIEQDILSELDLQKNPTQGDLLKAVSGKAVTKLKVLEELLDRELVIGEEDGRAMRYRLNHERLKAGTNGGYVEHIPVEEVAA